MNRFVEGRVPEGDYWIRMPESKQFPGGRPFHPVASPWMHFRVAARRWRIREIFLVLLQDSPNVIWNCKRHFVVCAHLARLGGDDDDSSRQKRVRVTVDRKSTR